MKIEKEQFEKVFRNVAVNLASDLAEEDIKLAMALTAFSALLQKKLAKELFESEEN